MNDVLLRINDPEKGEIGSSCAILLTYIPKLFVKSWPHSSNMTSNEISGTEARPSLKPLSRCPPSVYSILFLLPELTLFLNLDLLPDFFNRTKSNFSDSLILVDQS